jgi:Cu(I)/Ag(I) efflux system membrane protein CusA/SilA
MLSRLIRFCLETKLVVFLLVLFVVVWGVMVAPFDWTVSFLHRDPVPVDAIPDIGENQQVVFAEWMGRSPKDVEDQVTYPLTVALLGVPKVKTIRSNSAFGFSMIFIIFEEDAEFYWTRSRVLEKLNSLPAGTLPDGVQPMLGPDATPLGQVFWYTLEGREVNSEHRTSNVEHRSIGKPTGGWDLAELRSIQDWTVRYALQSAEGVSEVASIGGYVKEYQVDVDPDAMRAHNVTLQEVVNAVRMSNLDIGASVFEVNRVEYTIRGVGFVKSVADLEHAVIKVADHVPIYVKNVAHVALGPELRRGALDKEGAEVVGGVVVVRYGENPLAVIQNVKKKIAEISVGLPRKTLPDGTVSQVAIVPFYDRTELIYETLGTLSSALALQIMVTVIVVLIMVRHVQSSLLISSVMPLAVLTCFIAMRLFKVDANIVSLTGIAIAIGTMVDMGIIICENILKHVDGQKVLGCGLEVAGDGKAESDSLQPLTCNLQPATPLELIHRACTEVGPAVLTAIATTVVGFLPVFTMEAAEGKLFRPLAFTKTFALMASVVIALTIIPALAHLLFFRKRRAIRGARGGTTWILAILVAFLLTWQWLPLGPDRGLLRNFLLVAGLVGLVLGLLQGYQRVYPGVLRWCLDHKRPFLAAPALITFAGLFIWVGFDRLFGWLPRPARTWAPVSAFAHAFPGLGKEFMPPLDEGSYLYMPTAMPHASIGEVLDIMQKQDMAFYAIPEVASAVGKLGRAESPLDPAPVPMIETIIIYKSQFLTDATGKRLTFRHDPRATDYVRDVAGEPLPAPDGEPYIVKGKFLRDAEGRLIPDRRGKPFRLWRPALDPALNEERAAWPGIRSPNAIWDEILVAGRVPGSTSAPRLQPIATRLVMLQSGLRAPMGLKVYGPDLETVERVGLEMERLLKEVPMIEPATVIADRIVGKPYLEIVPDRQALARYGVNIEEFQDVLEVAIGGKRITTTVEGRERYPVRVRYLRERRDSIEALERILVPTMDGAQIPLIQVAEIRYVRGPEMIKSEETFLVGYVLFDKQPQYAEVDVVEQADRYLKGKLASGELIVPAGVSYRFAGAYENQLRAQRKLAVVLPLSLFIIFLILYFQFKDYRVTFFVFSGILVSWGGGFILIWLYGQDWFLNFAVFGTNLRDLFQVHPVNLSVAIWVGFLALFGVASDDGVIMCTYLDQRFAGARLTSVREIRQATLEAGMRRIRPCMMTIGTTILALLPVLTSTGRGADIMVPMAIPSFGGMLIGVITTLVAPVLYCALKEHRLARAGESPAEE